ncbi:MAG: hypothetical protein AAGG11_22740, partial [Pseudomonadota bacterium]
RVMGTGASTAVYDAARISLIETLSMTSPLLGGLFSNPQFVSIQNDLPKIRNDCEQPVDLRQVASDANHTAPRSESGFYPRICVLEYDAPRWGNAQLLGRPQITLGTWFSCGDRFGGYQALGQGKARNFDLRSGQRSSAGRHDPPAQPGNPAQQLHRAGDGLQLVEKRILDLLDAQSLDDRIEVRGHERNGICCSSSRAVRKNNVRVEFMQLAPHLHALLHDDARLNERIVQVEQQTPIGDRNQHE